jgi:hypothetical protein
MRQSWRIVRLIWRIAHRKRIVGAQIANAYRERPQTDEELRSLDESTKTLIEEEPW